MSYQKDYLLRMIEMIAELIAGILGLIKKGDFQQAEGSIDRAYHNYLKEDAAFFRKINLENLTNELIEIHHYSNGHLEILAELFFAEAELLKARGHATESIDFYQKSLVLHKFVIGQSATFSVDKEDKINLLQNQINQLKSSLN